MQSDDRSSLMIFLKKPQFWLFESVTFFRRNVAIKKGSVAQWFISMPRIASASSNWTFFPCPALWEGWWSGTNKDNQAVALAIHARCICSWGE